MFYLVEICIGIIFMLIDVGVLMTKIPSAYFKYASIVLCGIYAMYVYRQKDRLSSAIMLAIFLVLISDYLLLFTTYYVLGIAIFCIVQGCYLYLLQQSHKEVQEYFLFVIIGASLAIILHIPIFMIVTGVYICITIYNVYGSIRLFSFCHQKEKRYICATILLLCICDIFVALQYLQIYAGTYIWLFYLPSQLCLVRYLQVLQNKE